MGLVYFGMPPQLIVLAKEKLGIRSFVETGTFRGDTAAFAGQHFERVYTVEFVEERARVARERFEKQPNVKVLQGNSPEVIRQIAPELTGSPVLFWLDAHWNGDGESREFECPVAEELQAINDAQLDAFILIDDARYFIAPPPPPHDVDQWPSLERTVPFLTNGGRRHLVIVDDILMAWPMAAKELLIEYARSRPYAWTMAGGCSGGVFYIPKAEVAAYTVGP